MAIVQQSVTDLNPLSSQERHTGVTVQSNRLIVWAFTAALAGFLFGFDTIVISGAEQRIQAGIGDNTWRWMLCAEPLPARRTPLIWPCRT